MNRFLVRLTAVVGLVVVVAAAPIRKAPESTDISNGFLAKREFSCAKTVEGLTASDCKYMSKMGMKGQGVNARKNPGSGIWVGEDGHNTFVFENESKGKVTVIIWNKGTLPDGKPDYEGHCMNVRVPQVSWSLAKGEKVTVSLSKEKVSGGFAAIYEGSTKINGFGQIDQTWGEFTTGDYATVDVSRLIRMDGEPMSMRTSVGTVSTPARPTPESRTSPTPRRSRVPTMDGSIINQRAAARAGPRRKAARAESSSPCPRSRLVASPFHDIFQFLLSHCYSLFFYCSYYIYCYYYYYFFLLSVILMCQRRLAFLSTC
ncbi:hypothetical protein RB597_007118 [Gaeumannomyces tritici]